MNNIHSVIDLAQLALGLQKVVVSVAAENIANVNNAQYLTKAVNGTAFLAILEEQRYTGGPLSSESMDVMKSELIAEEIGKEIRLDEEVFNISNAELRYQAISQMISGQLGLLEIATGGKGK
jgi:flagellar basal body rod protein FlgB